LQKKDLTREKKAKIIKALKGYARARKSYIVKCRENLENLP